MLDFETYLRRRIHGHLRVILETTLEIFTSEVKP
jgi:hypothetical protein